MKKLSIALVFGGRSGEHEVSLTSAFSFLAALDQDRFTVIQIGVSRQGQWLTGSGTLLHLASEANQSLLPEELRDRASSPDEREVTPLALTPVPQAAGLLSKVDAVFPLIHGTTGEDGCLQGFLELAVLPYVGSGVLGSALAMDKPMTKSVLSDAGLPIAPYQTVLRSRLRSNPAEVQGKIERSLRYPLFIKPANLGSSVGITKVHDKGELLDGLTLAARYDRRVIVEQGLDCREIECAVLGNDEPEVSPPGEIKPAGEFYDYDSKYVDDSGLLIPAPLSEEQTAEARRVAEAAFLALDLAGMARVDLFLEKSTGSFYVNEVNTIPGFTPISMYPKLWKAAGLSYNGLIARLVELAQQRHAELANRDTFETQ